jgi:ABC-type lipoprotein release transport system permease subunit
LGGTAEATDWVAETTDLLRLQNLRQRALSILVTVLMLMSALAIANTILMAAHERVAEIGTMRALGMTRRSVLTLFLLEGGMMGLGAGAIGATAGGVLAARLAKDPIDLAALGAAQAVGGNLQFSTWLYAEFSPAIVLVPALISVTVAVLASLGPARVASRIEPADAVRAR